MAGSPIQPETVTVACPHCRSLLPLTLLNQSILVPCPSCQTPVQALIFPALIHALPAGSRGEAILTQGEASCFHHPEKRAVACCQRCGRFLCALCQVEWGAEPLCPSCLHLGQRNGTLPELDHRRILYDHIALAVAIVPLIILWPLTFLTGPAAIALGVYSFRKPTGIASRSRWRSYLAIGLGMIQISVWVAFLILHYGAAQE